MDIMTEPWENEKRIVESTKEPITKKRLLKDLYTAGVRPGDTIIVHASMKSIGWIVGGAVTVIEALMEAVTKEGTLVMPTQSTDNGEPSQWVAPPVPEDWWDIIRKEMPPYNPATTPTRKMGIIAETFRKYLEVYRSAHPQASFAAWGKNAHHVIQIHPIDDVFGKNSPLGRLYDLNAKILLIGIGYNANTSLHHAEFRANLPNMPRKTMGAAILEDGKRVWATWEQFDYNDDDFPEIAETFEKTKGYSAVHIGQAESHTFSMVELVNFAIEWIQKNRD
ncbi:AAC(3) family N-acetyltransferase [Candidatus Thorarchaeota archaeon]|nr:MAG: AAC(3) family N-acetyltransferase [Candidatus Thorarchaeota archaeon]